MSVMLSMWYIAINIATVDFLARNTGWFGGCFTGTVVWSCHWSLGAKFDEDTGVGQLHLRGKLDFEYGLRHHFRARQSFAKGIVHDISVLLRYACVVSTKLQCLLVVFK